MVDHSWFYSLEDFWYTPSPSQVVNQPDLTIIVQIWKKEQLINKELRLSQNYILWASNKWIKLDNLIMVKSQKENGIKLMRGIYELEIFGDLDKLIQYMKKYVIQVSFLGQYKIYERLACGDRSSIYRVRSRYQEQQYAAKVFEKNKNNKEWIQKEIEILRVLDHPNIISLLEVFEQQDRIILIFNLYKSSLHDFLIKTPIINENQTKLVAAQLLDALSYLHQRGIFHRDLKPQNILLKQDDIDNLILTDFGLSDYWNPTGNYLFTRCGTPGYVAPEILNSHQYSLKVDVFSVGILMYVMLTGKQAFLGNDQDQVIISNYHGVIDMKNLNISEDGLQFMDKILNRNVVLRYSSQEALDNQYIKSVIINKRQQQDFYSRNKPDILPQINLSGSPNPICKLSQLVSSRKLIYRAPLSNPTSPTSQQKDIQKLKIIKKSKFLQKYI